MPRRCYVEWCFTGYDSKNKENKMAKKDNNSTFQAPKDPALRMKWDEAIGRVSRRLSVGDSVCELHFANSDILRYYETLMPDGSIHRIPRRPSLRPGAIPRSRFIEEPGTDLEFRKILMQEEDIFNTTEIPVEKLDEDTKVNIVKIENVVPTPDVLSDASITYPAAPSNHIGYTNDSFRLDLQKLRLPERWAFVCVDEVIHFPLWNSKLTTTVTVTIKNDMSGEISVPGVSRTITHLLNLTSFHDFTASLISLERKKICEGSGTHGRRAYSCPILMPDTKRNFANGHSHRCLPCRVLRHGELAVARRRENTRLKAAQTRTEFISVKRKNMRLMKKVLKLKAEIDDAKKNVLR